MRGCASPAVPASSRDAGGTGSSLLPQPLQSRALLSRGDGLRRLSSAPAQMWLLLIHTYTYGNILSIKYLCAK